MGYEVVASTPQQFTAYIAEQRAKYDKLIRQIGIKAE
jgi:tripartite-type tricarboxylate transporter receptor subunit TctC